MSATDAYHWAAAVLLAVAALVLFAVFVLVMVAAALESIDFSRKD